MGRPSWTWARDEIAQCDVASDAHRIAHLSFVVRYGEPIFLHALFSVAFVYNVGLPEMAKILYRDGRGPILRDTRKRNFDSLTYFGEMYRHGDGPVTRQITDRLLKIHSNFPINSDMFLYTLSTLACLPRRVSERFMGNKGLTDKECEAQYRFWCSLGELMQIKNIPQTQESFIEWMLTFEETTFKPSVECTAIAKALADEWADYWMAAPLKKFGVGLFYALIDPVMRRRLQIPEPTAVQAWTANAAVKTYFLLKRVLPDPGERHMSDFFGRAYGKSININQVGYKGSAT